MKDLAITQEYLVCALNSKGKISGVNVEKSVCLIASGLLELQLEDCIKIENKKVAVVSSLPNEKLYLKPLYDFVNKSKPIKLEKILEEYLYSVTDKNLQELINSIGKSLENLGAVEATSTGILKNKTAYIPNKEVVNYVVDMVRSELLEDVELTEDIAVLTTLLEKSKLLKTYFSEYEQKEIKDKLKEIKKSDTSKMVKEMIAYIENMIAIMTVVTAFN